MPRADNQRLGPSTVTKPAGKRLFLGTVTPLRAPSLFLNFCHGQSWRCLRKNFQECPFHCCVHVGVDALDLPRVVHIFQLDFFTASQHVNYPSRTLACREEPRNFVGPFARQAPTMTAIRIVFRSQSPEWMAATCHGVLSHMMAPTHIMPENPNQSAR